MRLFLRLTLLLLGLVPWVISAQAQAPAFSCDGTFYQIRQVNGTSQIFKVDRSNPASYTTTALNIMGGTSNDLGVLLNGLAYNSQDGYMYALTTTGNSATIPTTVTMYKIGQGGISALGTVKVGTANLALIVATGTFDKAGHYYFSSQNTGNPANYNLYTLDLNSTTPLVATATSFKTTAGAASNSTFYDFAYNPVDGLLYGASWVGSLFKIDQSTGTVTNISAAPTQSASQAVGSLAFDVAGNLFAYNNGDANNPADFFQVNPATGVYTTISAINTASVSDGASCINPGYSIDVTKTLNNVRAVNAYTFDITYSIRVRNTYTSTLPNVQVSDILTGTNSTFPTATSVALAPATAVTIANLDGSNLAVNAGFTGTSTTTTGTAMNGASLLSGTQALTASQRAIITYTVRVTFGTSAANVPTTAQNNTAYATSSSVSPNRGYIVAANGALLSPSDLLANDASTNTADFPVLRAGDPAYGTPMPVDAPSPTPVAFSPSISGTVFEDVNYGGGLGRSQGTSNGVGRPGARVELYSGTGTSATFVSAQTTLADGSYSFTGLTAGSSYVVRVVTSTVTSSRNTGSATGLLGVQTYRTSVTAAAGTTPDPNRVGGEYPARADAGNGSTTLGALSLSTTSAPESIANVTLASFNSSMNTPAVDVDFGYNFDTVVNTNSTGQGSLAQFITNANALDNSGLDQDPASTGGNNPVAGVETSIFMITDGAAHDGLTAYNATTNPGLASQLAGSTNGVGGTVATITPSAVLPTLTGTYAANTSIDGTTQTQNVGNTNSLVLGTGGTVGTGSKTLDKVGGPEVQLTGGTSIAYGLDVAASATGTTISGLAIYGFGNALDNNDGANIRSAANGLTVTQSVLGATATSFAAPGVAANADNIRLIGGTAGISITNNLIGYSNSKGISISSGVTNVSVTDNEIRSNGQGGSNYDGVDIQGSLATVMGNLLTGTSGQGVDSYRSVGGNTINGNTITDNGRGTTVSGVGETPGVRIYGANNTISQNIISDNYGAGIMLEGATGVAAVSNTVISQNSIFNNGNVLSRGNAAATGQIGIDLQVNGNAEATGTSTYVTINSATTTGANGLLNFPVLTSTALVGNTLVVTGYAKTGATVELFTTQNNPSAVNALGTYFGQGKNYLASFTVGTTGGSSYAGPINGVNPGSDTNAQAFTVTLALTNGQLNGQTISNGLLLTSTATLNNATSEFSSSARVIMPPVPNDVTNANVADNTVVGVVLNPNVSASAPGLTSNITTTTANSIASYTVSPITTGGTLYYNGTAVTAATSVPVANIGQLTFIPTRGFIGNATFTYTATDVDGLTSGTHNTSGTASAGPATYTIPVVASADVTASLSGGTTLSAGLPTSYYVATFTNLGPDAASGVTQLVTLPAGASILTAQRNVITTAYPGTTFNTAGTVITFPAQPTMASGAINAYRFAFTAPAATGSSTIVASTSPTSSEGANVAPNTATLTLNTTAVVDVQTTLVASAASLAPGAAASFTATFANPGTLPAAGIVSTVQLPLGLTPTSVSGQAGTVAGANVNYGTVASLNTATGVLTYAATTLAAGANGSSAIAFTMPSTGVVNATASITTTDTESNPTNNVASASITAAPSFDLSTTLYGPTAVVAGSPITLNVTTTNNGPQAVAGAVQTVQLPAGLNGTTPAASPNVFVSNGGTYNNTSGLVTFPALGSLPSGQTVANTISFVAPNGSFTPVATVTPNTTAAGETNTNNNVAYLNGAANGSATGAALAPGTATSISANIYAILSTTSTIVAAGTQVTYTTGVGNAGASTASNVTGQLQLIPGLGIGTLTVAGTSGVLQNGLLTYANGASYNPTTGLLTFPAPASYPAYATLTSAATNTFAVVVTVPASVGNGGQLLATASVGSATSDAVPADNVKAVAITVLPITDVATTITGPTSGVLAGQSVTYTATYTNNGPAAASATTETVQLPAGLTASSLLVNGSTGAVSGANIVYTSGGATVATYTPATGLVTLPAIASDAAGAVQSVNLTFPAPARNYVVSSAVSSATTETNQANNAASVATTVTPTTDVSVAIAGPATAVIGNYVTYTLTTTNNGPSTATNVIPSVQLPKGLVIQASGPGTTPAPVYNSTTGLLTFNTIASLQAGVSAESYVTFTMPNITGGQISGVASVSSTTTDNVPSNNTAALTTSVAPVTTATADVLTSINIPAAPTSVVAGSLVTYTIAYRNNSGISATGVVPTAALPSGLTQATLQVGGATGTQANGLITFANGATYEVATGLLTFPTIASLPVSSAGTSYSVTFPAPASGPLIVVSSVSSETSDNVPDNNNRNSNVPVTPAFDLTTSLTGPAVALPGTPNVYTVTTTSSGPSAAAATQTVALPSGLTGSTLLVAGQTGSAPVSGVITYSNTGTTYNTSTGVLTFPAISLAPGSVTNSFTVTMPASGTLVATATVSTTTSGETNGGNNTATLPTSTATPSLAPVAENIINRKQSARGNTSNTNLPLLGLNATDPDGVINNYTITSLPTSGTLYYNGVAIIAANYPVADTSLLSYKPATGFVGNAFFTYTATDTRGVSSNSALYTIPVAQDQSSAYTAYNTAKGGSNTYKDSDVLAQAIDANTARYNSSSIIYNTSGALQSGASNGLPLTGTNATLPSTGPAGNPSNTLPSGVSLDPATGRIYVSTASLLPKVTTATTYSVFVITTDLNGGINQVLATFTIGAYPLPVVLTEFTATAVANRDALLKWATASEKNNDHFEVERSFDGTSFSQIAKVAGHGTTTTASAYALTDANVASKATGPVYYRLRQVDLDGTATFSPVRTVSFTAATAPVALGLYPNPAATQTSLDLSALPATGTYQVLLLDATGRAVRSWSLGGGLVQPLDVQELASGAYLLLVTGQQPNGSALKQTLRLTKD
ncbi:MAG: hypothetical protein ACRYFZ_12605 [Janthinobacterium lividum]